MDRTLARVPHVGRTRGVLARAAGGPAQPGVTSRASYANTAAWVRSRRPSLTRIRPTWVFIVYSATTRCAAISAFDRPWAISDQHLRLALGQIADPRLRAGGARGLGRAGRTP